MTRRCISLLVLLCFGFFSAETFVADVHDGDATAAEIAKATAGANIASMPAPAETDGPTKGDSQHSTHVCHCVHAHGGLNAVPMTLSELSPSHDKAPALDMTPPAKVDLDVHLRPPIA